MKVSLVTTGLRRLNYACFAVGMVSAWMLTQDWRVLAAVFVASLHFSVSLAKVEAA